MIVNNKSLGLLFLLIGFIVSAQQSNLEKANSYIKSNKIAQAKEILLLASQKNPDPKITERLGDVYGIEKDWDAASKYYKVLVDKYPENANYHFKYGGVLGMISLESKIRALTLLDDVKEHFKIACALDKEHLDVRWASIDLYLKLPGILGGSNEKAYQYSEELSTIAPIEGYLSKGFIEAERNNEKLAETYYQRALDVVVKNSFLDKNYRRKDIHYQIGDIAYQYKYQIKAGIDHMLVYKNLHTPESIIPLEDVYYRLAVLYRYQNNIEKATYYIEEAIVRNPNSKDFISENKKIKAL